MNLGKSNIHTLNDYLANLPTISIPFDTLRADQLAKSQLGKALFRARPKRLTALWSINAAQANLVLHMCFVEYRYGVTVHNCNYPTSQYVSMASLA